MGYYNYTKRHNTLYLGTTLIPMYEIIDYDPITQLFKVKPLYNKTQKPKIRIPLYRIKGV